MRFKIRTKLITAFLAIIFPFIALAGVIALYKRNTIIMGIITISDMIEEREAVTNLQIAFDRVIMPGNDYIITAGDKRYIDDFQKGSENVERLLESAEAILGKMEGEPLYQIKEKMEMLKGAKVSWRNIKEISLKIFAIPNPADNKDAVRLVEEMDYKWAYPAIERLNKWNEISYEEFLGAVMGMGREWRRAWVIMIAGAGILIISGVSFAIFYSRLFTRPIEDIRNDAEAIAGGDFKTRLDVKTGDEIEGLANAMNEMAAQLDNFHSNLQGMVDERTRELAEQMDFLERFHKAAVQREFRIKELKDRVKGLDVELKKVRSS